MSTELTRSLRRVNLISTRDMLLQHSDMECLLFLSFDPHLNLDVASQHPVLVSPAQHPSAGWSGPALECCLVRASIRFLSLFSPGRTDRTASQKRCQKGKEDQCYICASLQLLYRRKPQYKPTRSPSFAVQELISCSSCLSPSSSSRSPSSSSRYPTENYHGSKIAQCNYTTAKNTFFPPPSRR
jgi:hypothetical protein